MYVSYQILQNYIITALWMAVGPRCHATRHLRIVPGATITPANVVDMAVRIGSFSKNCNFFRTRMEVNFI
jgi:hypothetical protein